MNLEHLSLPDLIAHASTISEVPSTFHAGDTGGPASERDLAPHGPNTTLVDHIVARWRAHGEHAAREWAITAIEQVRQGPKLTYRDRLIVDFQGIDDDLVTEQTGTPRTTVRRWREKAGLDPRTGLPVSRQLAV